MIYRPETKSYQSLGKTPLSVESELLSLTSFFDADMVALVVRKQGFVPQSVVLDKSSNPKFTLSVNLDPLSDWGGLAQTTTAAADGSPTAEKALRSLRSIDLAIAQGKLDAAFAEAQQLQKEFPASAFVWDVLGSLHLRLGRNAAAIECYKKSLSLDPDNQKTALLLQNILQRAERDAGGKAP
jgi:tetratricopeptide (TPR) repeat protein